MAKYAQVLTDLREPTRQLRHEVPDTWAGFLALHDAAMTDGTLSRGLKEAVALALAVVQHCEGCIAYHAKAAARAGATREEVAEVLGVALLMGGGPASVYAPEAWEAFVEFTSPAEAPAMAPA